MLMLNTARRLLKTISHFIRTNVFGSHDFIYKMNLIFNLLKNDTMYDVMSNFDINFLFIIFFFVMSSLFVSRKRAIYGVIIA